MKYMTAIAALAFLAACSPDAADDSAPKADAADAAADASAQTQSDPASTLADRGRRLFNECAVCHSAKEGDANRIGPNLFGVAGSEAGKVDGFGYSQAMASSGVIWDDASLDAFLANPQQFMRGTRMAYAGQRDEEKRAALIAYLKSLAPATD